MLDKRQTDIDSEVEGLKAKIAEIKVIKDKVDNMHVEKLKELGVSFERIVNLQMKKHDFSYGEGWHYKMVDGIHDHFMVGRCDVAYHTPLMKSLIILDNPREWHEDFLAKTRLVGRFNKELNEVDYGFHD